MSTRHRASVCLIGILAGCGGPDEAPPAADSAAASATEVMFSAAQVQHGGVRWAPAGLSATGGLTTPEAIPGQLAPDEDRTARLGAPAQGRVLSVMVSPGERVRAGQILATMQSPDAGAAQSDLAKATADLGAHRAQAAYARSAKERAERLLALKSISRQEFERAVADDALAQSELTRTDAELARARSTAGALGALDQPAGQLALRAPAPGVVLERLAVPGAVVEAGTPLMVTTDPGILWLTVNAPEALAGGLRVGATLRFVVPAFPAETTAARITSVAAGLDPDTRSLSARALVPNPRGRLKPAMLATVYLPVPAADPKAPQAIVLPDSAVQLVDGAPTVFLAMPDEKGGAHLMSRRVELGARLGNQVVILSGISAGDLVVVAGAFAVKSELKKGSMPKMEM